MVTLPGADRYQALPAHAPAAFTGQAVGNMADNMVLSKSFQCHKKKYNKIVIH